MVTPGGERVKTLYKKGEGCEKRNKQTNKQTNKTKKILYQFSHANIFVQNGPHVGKLSQRAQSITQKCSFQV